MNAEGSHYLQIGESAEIRFSSGPYANITTGRTSVTVSVRVSGEQWETSELTADHIAALIAALDRLATLQAPPIGHST